MAVVEVALRTVLAAVFVIAFISKVRSRAAFTEFATSLGDIGWLHRRWRSTVAALVPLFEAAVVVLLIVPVTVPSGFAAGAVLLVAFTAVTGAEVANGRRVRCRCFGAGAAPIGPAQIARNVVLLIVSIAGLALEPISHGSANGAGLVLGIGLATLAAVAFAGWDDLAYLLRAS